MHSKLLAKSNEFVLQVNADIQETELKLEQARDDIHTKKGELAVKNSKLADVEMEVKLMSLRKAILIAQREEITEAKKKIAEDYVRRILTP
jgi:chromosome segregation ATPase